MKLIPEGIDRAARRQETEDLEFYHVLDCIECGCCTYACPAKRYLTQSIRNGKTLVRAERKRVADEKKLRETEIKDQTGKGAHA